MIVTFLSLITSVRDGNYVTELLRETISECKDRSRILVREMNNSCQRPHQMNCTLFLKT